MWAAFDAAIGLRHETLGDVMLTVGAQAGIDATTLRLVGAMQASALRVYSAANGGSNSIAMLRDLLTGDVVAAHVPTNRPIEQPELWLVRLLPPVREGELAIAMTTPYVLQGADESAWRAYFQRALGAAATTPAKTQAALKFRIDWLEYIFAAYIGHSFDAVDLTGLPDQPATLRHYSAFHPLARFGRGPKKK